jgi:uncharacterized membrane protein
MMRGYGMTGSEWIMMFAVLGGLLAVIVFAITRLVNRDDSGRERDSVAVLLPATPREILDARLASGEIDPEAHRAISERLVPTAER